MKNNFSLSFPYLLFLKTFCDRNSIPLVLKISGGEAIRDIKDANKLQIKKESILKFNNYWSKSDIVIFSHIEGNFEKLI